MTMTIANLAMSTAMVYYDGKDDGDDYHAVDDDGNDDDGDDDYLVKDSYHDFFDEMQCWNAACLLYCYRLYSSFEDRWSSLAEATHGNGPKNPTMLFTTRQVVIVPPPCKPTQVEPSDCLILLDNCCLCQLCCHYHIYDNDSLCRLWQ